MGPVGTRRERDENFRDYGIGAQILRDLGVRKMRLITNKYRNLVGLSGYGLEVTLCVPLSTPPSYKGKDGKPPASDVQEG